MKKIVLLVVGILFSISTLWVRVPKVSAYTDETVKLWRFEEVMERSRWGWSEIWDKCGSNADCIFDEYDAIAENDPELRIALDMGGTSLMMTSINPGEKTARFIFNAGIFDTDVLIESKEKIALKHLWIAGPGNYGKVTFANEGLSGGAEVFYDDDGEEMDSTEVELSLEGIRLTGVDMPEIYWMAETYNYGKWYGGFVYDSCLKSPQYKPGMDCVAMVNSWGSLQYIPGWVGMEEPVIEEPTIEEPVVEEPVIEEPVTEEPVVEEPVTEEPVVDVPVEDVPSVNLTTEEENFDDTKFETAPKMEKIPEYHAETTQVAAKMEDKLLEVAAKPVENRVEQEIEIPLAGGRTVEIRKNVLPWWLLVLILGAILMLLWLFWPKRAKKSKKS